MEASTGTTPPPSLPTVTAEAAKSREQEAEPTDTILNAHSAPKGDPGWPAGSVQGLGTQGQKGHCQQEGSPPPRDWPAEDHGSPNS